MSGSRAVGYFEWVRVLRVTRGVPFTRRAILSTFATYADFTDGGSLRKSVTALAEELDVNRDTASRHIAAAVRDGWLRIVQDNSKAKRPSVYQLTIPGSLVETVKVRGGRDVTVYAMPEAVNADSGRGAGDDRMPTAVGMNADSGRGALPTATDTTSSTTSSSTSSEAGGAEAAEQEAILRQVADAPGLLEVQELLDDHLTRWPSPWPLTLDRACSDKKTDLLRRG